MTDPSTGAEGFQALIGRVRAGDEEAATELVRRYEPAVRRAARVRLVDTRLNRMLDSMDVCQSVMASFFVRTALGQYELETPDQLLKLLATMTRNKLANVVKAQGAQRRDFRRTTPGQGDAGAGGSAAGAAFDHVAGALPTPSREVAAREMLDEARRRLSPDELRLLDDREAGRDWAEIASELGASPEALRKRLARAVDRVAGELGLE
ncbi:RNA polymerase sigma factor [Paludisphaera mucosa]|uniref:Sigma-70 family RNA polymerase sigma factor n=1 Tax=Paludisphaera mucosa TaxID=3030827 RepID=A0ABT6FBP8_9BACT|nr:sigma-70 family RNA polymerase sigma factor [Paludisphaera mucosa]MDG3005013.1 sigma-70 family RNA polymerase sigma factor [Paludisphaera mucosa]